MPPITLTVPPDLIQAAVDKAVAERLQHEPDYRCWWTKQDIAERYQVKAKWLDDHILNVPKFQRALDGFAFNYGGQTGWRFEPKAFSDFMRVHFRDIAKEGKKF